MIKADCTDFVKWSNDLTRARKLLPLEILRAMNDGLAIVSTTSKSRYLSGPRPMRLGRRTGDLATSLKTKSKLKGSIIEGAIGTPKFYGRFWEDGFKGKRGFMKRAFMKPAIDDSKNKLTTLFEKAGVKVLK